MSNDDVLEQNGQDESSSVDIVELLAAANSKVFDDQNGLIDTNKNFEKVSSALKELESNKIIAHLSRENFRKISFPIFVQSEYLKSYLKGSGLQFELSLFLENSNFQKIELDS